MDFAFFLTGFSGLFYLWLLSLAILLCLYFSVGFYFEWLSARHPERRIQKREFSDRATDIRQSLTSLPTIAFYFAAGLWLQANGYTLFALWEPGILNFIIGFAISVVVYDAWFYWAHRMLHLRAFYRFHAQHHVSIAPTAWSNNNDSLIGTFLEQSYFLVGPLVFPFSPLVFIAHKVFDQVASMIGHVGFEFMASPLARKPWPGISTTFHDQHHSHFKVNYANMFSFWDRLFGTLHPDYDKRVKEFEAMGKSTPGS